MKCPRCFFPMIWKGAFETAEDGVKYKVYGCNRTPECPRIVRGEKIEQVEVEE